MRRKVIQGLFLGGRPRVPAQVAQANGPRQPPAPAQGASGAFPVDPGQLGLANGSGQPLPDEVRGKMEAALDADLSAVQVHVGPQAERIGALAFTMGTDIYFAPGRFQPETVQGQQMLGHELAHVVQQREGRVRNRLGAGLAVVAGPSAGGGGRTPRPSRCRVSGHRSAEAAARRDQAILPRHPTNAN
jgi:Domain of unknown function (DUF4157)